MNTLLFDEGELTSDGLLTLHAGDYRFEHIRSVLRSQAESSLKVGQLNGLMGTAEIVDINTERCNLLPNCEQGPPPALDLHLILALPRPKMMRRVLQNVASMGVKRITLLNSSKVEKSYWQTPWLSSDQIRRQLILGLEQACDTMLPEVTQEKLFKPYIEDRLPTEMNGNNSWLAHPTAEFSVPEAGDNMTLAIGPEGGFTEYEVRKFEDAGFQSFHLGRRILRVETVLPALLGRLYL